MTGSECEFPKFNATPEEIKSLISSAKRIAVVGLSNKPNRASYQVADYLKQVGYQIIPVNPGHTEILGETCYKHLSDVPGPIDIVDIFRPPEAIPEIVNEAIKIKAKSIWMQLGIVNNAAAETARDAGLIVVMNRCLKVDHAQMAS